MFFWMALLLGTTAIAVPTAQQPRADASEQSRTERSEHIASMIAAKQTAEASTLVDALLADYENAYADEKRRPYCAEDIGVGVPLKAPRDAVVIGPGWCRALWAKGYILSDNGQAAAAIPYLKRALAMYPGRRQYAHELTFAYQATRDWPAMLDAATHEVKAVRDSDGADRVSFLCKAWHGMAYAQIELGKWNDAETMLHKCLALDPDNVKAKSELDYIARARPKN